MKSICHLLNNCDQMCKKTFGVTFCIEYVVVILASLTLAYCYGKIKYFDQKIGYYGRKYEKDIEDVRIWITYKDLP